MGEECIFCKIVNREIPASIVYEDGNIIAFNDINPQAPVHIIIIPKKHIPRVMDLEDKDLELMGKLIMVAKKIAEERNVEEGYRIVLNCNPGAGQSVFHIHFHLLGGRKFGWPPG